VVEYEYWIWVYGKYHRSLLGSRRGRNKLPFFSHIQLGVRPSPCNTNAILCPESALYLSQQCAVPITKVRGGRTSNVSIGVARLRAFLLQEGYSVMVLKAGRQ